MYDEQDIKPSRSFDDIDREIRGQQRPPALKPPKPQKSFDDIDREVRSQSSPDAVQYPQNPKVGQTIPLRSGITMTYAGDPKDRPAQPPRGSMGWTGEDTDAQGKPTGRGMVYHKPVAAPGEFKSPINMDFRAPTEAQKMADRALQAPSAFQASRPKSTFERIQDQQALEMRQPQTVETDPIRLAQLQRETAEYQARKQRQQAEATTSRNQTLRKIGSALNPAIGLGNALNDAGVPDVNRVLQSGGKSVGSIVRGAAAASTMYPGAEGMYKFITGSSLRDTADRYGRQAERLTNQASEALLPEQEQDQSFRAKIERGAGSMLPPVGAALATGGGSAMAAGVGALANLGQVASERDQSGVPVSDTRRAMSDTMAVATGMTEALGIGRLLNRVGLKTPLIHRVAQMVEEGGQEYAQDYLNDINAKLVAAYDPQRQINDPLAAKRLESAAIGAILGGAGEVADVGAQRIQQQVQNRAAVRSVANERPNLPTDIRPTTLGPTQVTTVPSARPATSAQPTVDAQPHTAQNDFQKHFALRYQNGQFTLDDAIPLEQAPPQNVKALVDVLQGFQTKPDVPPEMAGAAQNLLQQVQSRLSQMAPASGVAEPSPAFPRLPEPEGFNARRAKLLGMDVPSEIAINERIAQADKLLGSQNESDQRLGKRILKQSLEEIQKSEGYQGELGQPDDTPKPYTAVRQAIEDRLKPAPKATFNEIASAVESESATENRAQTATSALRAEADAAKIKAAEFEQSGDFANAAQTYDTTHKNLKLLRRKLGIPKTAEDVARINQIDREISAAASNRQRANVQARQMARQANAPTAGLAGSQRDKIPNNIVPAENNIVPAETAPLLRPEAVQNPEGGIPQMPEQTFSGRLQQAINRQEAQKPAAPAKRLISRIKELGGIDSRHVGEMQGLKDARNVGVIRNGAKMSPDVLARQLQSEGYDIDPENLNTLWAAIDRDVAGKNERPANTADLNQRLKQEEEAHYAKQQPTKSFDQIAADVDSETGALQRAIDRSNEREHAMPSEGVGLVSMSPYADMVMRNRDAVDRLYQSGMASQEGKEVFRNLREFAAKNGIEARHLHALADDVRNFELEKARWADRGIDFSTVQSLDEGTARLRDSVLEDAKSLPNVERTALEREVAALDALFDDPNATNLLERAAEGDNNAANEFRKVATEYGIGADTIGDLIEARKPNRSANRAPRQNEARTPQSAGRDTRTTQEREARSATPEEFDLLNRNPATIPTDEFDAHLTAMEKLRNDEIRGIVKLSREDKREMFRQLRNLNEERKFRVQRKELPAKFESRTLPVDKEFVRQSVEKATQPKVAERRSEPMPERYTLRQMADNATAQYREAANRPGVVYLNDWGGAFLNRTLDDVFGVTTTDANFTMGSKDAKDLVNYIRDVQKDTGHDVSRIADELEKAITSAEAKGQDVAFVTRKPSEPLSLTKTKVRHESTHLSQSRLAEDLSTLTGNKWLDTQDNASTIRQELDRRGYPAETHDYEAAAFVASGDYGVFGMDTDQAASFLSDYFNAVVQRHGQRALQKFGAIDPKLQPTLEAARNENPTESQAIRSRTSQEAAGVERTSRQGSGDAGNVPSISERRERRDQEKSRIRASFGELENEPRGQVAASGLGGLQDLFSRKPKAAQPVPVPNKFNLGDWSQKFYRDAMAAGLDKADRAAYDAAKTPREKTAVLMSAKVDAKREQSIYDIIDKASDAATKNDGSALYDALSDATDMMRRQPMERGFARVKQEAGNALGVPRSLMASADISAPFRQGSLLTLPPSQWSKAAKATVRMFQAFNSEQYKQISKEINLHPDAETARDAGLYISTDKSGLVTKKEEDFLSNWTEKIPLVKHSEQAYKTYLDSLRMDTFARYKKSIDKTKGLSAEQKETAYKAAADWINVATGRGTLGQTFENAMPTLSKFMFAPRYTASRIQVLNPVTYLKNSRTAEGRAVLKNQMADMVQYAGVISATLAMAAANGAQVGLDPDDADFLKIKIGNTRYDTLAGLQQPMRLFYRMGKSLYGRTTGEKTKGNQSTLDIASRFGRSKLAPVPSFFVDYFSGRDFTGEKFKFSKAIVDRVTPLMWKDFYDAYQKEGLAGGAKILPGLTGIGVQNYGEKPNTLKSSAFSKAAADKGMKIETLKMKQGEPEAVFNERKTRVEGWMDTYGQKLLDSPRYKAMTDDEQKAAMKLLRARIGRQQNLKQPKPNSFEPNAVLLGVKKSAATKARRQSKYLYQP